MESRDYEKFYPKYDGNYDYKKSDVKVAFTRFELAIKTEMYHLMDSLRDVSSALKKGDVEFAEEEVSEMKQYVQELIDYLRCRYDEN